MRKFQSLVMSLLTVMACPVGSDQLMNINVTYWGFDQKSHVGTLVINKKVAPEIMEIFATLHQAKFPIEKIQPLVGYHYNENKAMQDNDTFAFNCRAITNHNSILSKHSYGIAIDINPLQNPYIKGETIFPPEGKPYIDRNAAVIGTIVDSDIVVQTFKKYGWQWGGNWKSLKDYQHFEKTEI
jgi:hypothetical protein